jgi:alpha-ribazole phosphatase
VNLYLLRHTTAALDSQRVCYGHTDIGLAASYPVDQADLFKRASGLWSQPLIYSSPLKRCAELAESLAAPSGAEIQFDDRLKELNFGDWEERLWEDIPRADLDAWANDFVDGSPPGGESYRALQERVTALLDELRARPLIADGNRDVLFVTHGGVIRALLAWALELPLPKSFTFEINPGSISAIRYSQGFRTVAFVNR